MINSFFSMLNKDLKLIFRNKQLLLVCFSIPFVLLFLFSYIYSGNMDREQSIEPMTLAVVDRENSVMTKMLIENFKGDKSFSDFINISVYSESEANERFKKGELTGILELPEGFSKSIYYCENYPVDLTINGNSYLKMQILENMMKSYSKFISAVESSVYGFNYYIDYLDISDKEKDKLNEKISINLVGTAISRGGIFKLTKVEDVPSSTSVEYFFISLIVIFLMYIGLTAGNFVVSERNNKNLKRLSSTPVYSHVIVISKCVSFLIFSIVFLFVFSIPMIIMKKIHITGNLSDILAFLLLSIFFIISFSVLMGCIFKSEEELMLFGNMFIFISALIGGSFIPIYMMPPAVQNISKLTFNYWIIKGYLYLFNSYTINEIWVIPMIFIVLSVIFIMISTYKIERCRG